MPLFFHLPMIIWSGLMNMSRELAADFEQDFSRKAVPAPQKIKARR